MLISKLQKYRGFSVKKTQFCIVRGTTNDVLIFYYATGFCLSVLRMFLQNAGKIKNKTVISYEL